MKTYAVLESWAGAWERKRGNQPPRELEADGFLERHDFGEVPPRVEYYLTEMGKSFIPVIEHMKKWGEENIKDDIK